MDTSATRNKQHKPNTTTPLSLAGRCCFTPNAATSGQARRDYNECLRLRLDNGEESYTFVVDETEE